MIKKILALSAFLIFVSDAKPWATKKIEYKFYFIEEELEKNASIESEEITSDYNENYLFDHPIIYRDEFRAILPLRNFAARCQRGYRFSANKCRKIRRIG